MGVTTFLFAQTIAPKKCNTCGVSLGNCQYKGKHGIHKGHEWVDLGLPSGTKWASTNIGANSPSDYGGYYSWGEITTKSFYDWNTCFDCINSDDWLDDSSWRTYKIGGKTIITTSSGHDAARENWKGKWRMPTDAECGELCKKCTWTWTTLNGHNGCKVLGPNGNSIFLPAAGRRSFAGKDGVGTDGLYRSNTLSSGSFYSPAFSIGMFVYSYSHHTSNSFRRDGHSVRPVLDLN